MKINEIAALLGATVDGDAGIEITPGSEDRGSRER